MDGDEHRNLREALEAGFCDLAKLKALVTALVNENRLLRERVAGLRPVEDTETSDLIPALLRRQAE